MVVFGSLSQDLHLRMPRHPRAGETVLGEDIEYRFGGKGANQAVAAARAGAATLFIGRVGDDRVGHAYLQRLRTFGIDVSRTEVDPSAPTGTAIIYNDVTGESMIVVAPGANHKVSMADVAKLDDLTEADVLLMPLELNLEVICSAVRHAARRGTRVVLNLAPYAALPSDILDLPDPVVANESEAGLLAESEVWPRSMVATLGEGGSRWGDLEVPAEQVEVVDTTGAGDAYCGTLGARLCLGQGAEAAMRAASAAASACVTHAGAQPELGK